MRKIENGRIELRVKNDGHDKNCVLYTLNIGEKHVKTFTERNWKH